MKSPRPYIILLFLLCGCQNTDAMRHSAADLADKIASYRNEQKNRVDTINHDYQDQFARLMAEFTTISNARLQQSRDTDAQQIADLLIGDNKQTLIGTLRGTFASTVKSERDAIDQADANIATARNQYVQSYQSASLTLSKLETVQTDLRQLARAEDEVADAANVVQHLVAAEQTLSKNAQASTGKTPTTKLPAPARPLK